MYLVSLSEEQKALFMNLAYDVAMSDNDYSEQERLLMDSYAKEMQISWNESMVSGTLDEKIGKLNAISSLKEKRMIIFEIVGLAMSDRDYSEGEKEIVLGMCKKFGIDGAFEKECERCLREYFHLQARINTIVLEG